MKTPSDWLKLFDSQSEASIQWILKLTPATKRITPCERVFKNVPENGVFSCVPFCLRSLRRFARCGVIYYTGIKFEWSIYEKSLVCTVQISDISRKIFAIFAKVHLILAWRKPLISRQCHAFNTFCECRRKLILLLVL